MDCKERLEAYFREHGVAFELLTHSQAYTMQEVAADLHVSGKQVAKVVMVKADDKMVMLVLPAPYRLNLERVGTMLASKQVSLAKESDFTSLFPDCLPGAMPPFGNLYDVPVYADESLSKQSEIIFRVGTHQHTFKIAYADFERLAQPHLGGFAWVV